MNPYDAAWIYDQAETPDESFSEQMGPPWPGVNLPGGWLRAQSPAALAAIASQAASAFSPGGNMYRTMDDIAVSSDFSDSLRSRINQLAEEIANAPMQRDTSQLQNQMAVLMKLYGEGQNQLYDQDRANREAERYRMQQEVLTRDPELLAQTMTPAYVSKDARREKESARKLIMDQTKLFAKEFMSLQQKEAAGEGIPGAAQNPYAKLYANRKEIMQQLALAGSLAESGETDRAMAILYEINLKLTSPEAGAGDWSPAPQETPQRTSVSEEDKKRMLARHIR